MRDVSTDHDVTRTRQWATHAIPQTSATASRLASDGPKVVLEVGYRLNSYSLFFHWNIY